LRLDSIDTVTVKPVFGHPTYNVLEHIYSNSNVVISIFKTEDW